MPKKIPFVITLLAAIGVLVLSVANYRSSKASNQNLPDVYHEKKLKAAHQATQSPLALLEALNAKSTLTMNKPGWVYTQETTKYAPSQDNGTLPNGEKIPSEYSVESWFHVNEKGLSFEGVSIMTALDGRMIQVSVSASGKTWNSAIEEQESVYPQPLSALDFGFLMEAADFQKRTGREPEMTTSEVDGKAVIIFTLDEKLSEPIVTVDSPSAIIAVKTIAIYDADSGNLLTIEKSFLHEDGSKNQYSSSLIVEVGIEPPDSVFKLIEERK